MTEDEDIMIVTQFITGHELDIGDSVFLDTAFGREEMKISTEIMSPQYIYSVNPITGLPDLSGLAAS